VFQVDETNDRIFLVVKTRKEPLSPTYIHQGPPVRLKKNADEFLKKWEKDPRVVRKPYEENERILVELTREYTDIKDFLKAEVCHLSLGKHLDEIVQKNYDVIELDDLLTADLRVFWTAYLDKKMPWER
jgi:tRNA nucleotidyltransferase (CCA-adding enzyme)